jgi:redox-sensitive bicupin YhaK (pirin superfamily)
MSTNIEKNDGLLQSRTVLQQLPGIETADGDGVKLTRIIGSPHLNMLDPFLLLDCFESDDSKDYIGGFPTHPHRGFETVTYLLNGRMRHKDNAGHEGVVEPGGVQWMTAAKGILHSEMPEQEEGLMKGFQLWVNLPASAKMSEPAYQEYPPELTPLERRDDGTEIRVIAGQTNQGTVGPVVNEYTYPTYLDVSLPANTAFEQRLPAEHNAFVYVIDGHITVLDTEGDPAEVQADTLKAKKLGVLAKGDQVLVRSGDNGARFLLIAGQPLNEPVARGGPFVMNTKAEVLQAFTDFNRGNF